MMINDKQIDIRSRLDAMRVQEETMICSNYFKRNRGDITEAARKSMVQWIQQVQRTLSLSPETVWIGMSYFDRYLSSGEGNSMAVLNSRAKFQLAAITAFYTAVKIYEPVVLGIDMLLQICRGTYTESDVLSMEMDILSTLGWRVSVHTPMDFARHLLEVLPEQVDSSISFSLLQSCQKHLDYIITDVHFSCSKPSAVGISCLSYSLSESEVLSLSQKQAIWMQLSELCDFDLSSQEVVVAQQCLMAQSSPCKESTFSKQSKLSQQSITIVSAYSVDDGSTSSPTCVVQTARQA